MPMALGHKSDKSGCMCDVRVCVCPCAYLITQMGSCSDRKKYACQKNTINTVVFLGEK